MKRMRGFLVASALVTCTALGVRPAAGADEVLSGNIKEADKRSGQNTNTGSGIKTNHIQNSAVTSLKIKDGSVTVKDLANGAVTSAKIKDASVLAADLADGAVTAAKVGFYSRVIVVDVNGGGDFTSPVAAMASITDASAANPYLVKIMPGVYDVGQSAVQMKPFVDLEGSGENVTALLGGVETANPPLSALVVGASNAEIRFLSLSNTSVATSNAVGFMTPAASSPSLLHVRITAAGNGTTMAVYNGRDSKPVLTHVTAEARALVGSEGARTYGIYSEACSPVLADMKVSALGGSASNVGIAHFGSGFIAAAELKRGVVTADGEGSDPNLGNVGIYIAYSQSDPLYPVPTLQVEDVVTRASGGAGIAHVGGGASSLRNVVASGWYGMDNSGDAFGGVSDSVLVTAERCTFEGQLAAIRNDVEHRVNVVWGILKGAPAISAGGTLACTASVGGDFTPLSGCTP